MEGKVVLIRIPQADGVDRLRPSVVLRTLPPFGDLLICGISRQIHQLVRGFDELISASDDGYESSGLDSTSLIRLGFLSVVPARHIPGSIGQISPDRHRRLLESLSQYLTSNINH